MCAYTVGVARKDSYGSGGMTVSRWQVFEQNFPFVVQSFRKVRKGVYRVKTTTSGTLCVKLLDGPTEHVYHVVDILLHLRDRGFAKSPRLFSSRRGEWVFRNHQKYYLVTPWISGRQPNFQRFVEWRDAIQTLAQFHQSAEQFQSPCIPAEKIRYHDIFQKIESAEKILCKLEAKPSIDFSLDGLRSILLKAVEQVEHPEILTAIEQEQQMGAFIHGDYNYPNLVFQTTGSLQLIDFDNTSMQNRMIDLAHLLHRSATWDAQRMIEAIKIYQQIRPISNYDRRFLFTLLHIPYPLVRWYFIQKRHVSHRPAPLLSSQTAVYYSEKLEKELL